MKIILKYFGIALQKKTTEVASYTYVYAGRYDFSYIFLTKLLQDSCIVVKVVSPMVTTDLSNQHPSNGFRGITFKTVSDVCINPLFVIACKSVQILDYKICFVLHRRLSLLPCSCSGIMCKSKTRARNLKGCCATLNLMLMLFIRAQGTMCSSF